MKLRIVELVAGGAIALGGVALAQNVTEQFVVSGKAAEKIQDFTTINLATAERIADSCEKAASAEGVQISIMVLDNDGNHVYMDRMDGQGYLNIVTADMKARTALTDRAPSKLRMNRVIEDPTQELQQITVPPLVQDLPARANPNPGNAPVPRFVAATPPKSSLPEGFVVGGKGSGNVFDGNQISLAAAKKVARVCRDWAASKDGTMSLYIIDNAGEFVHMERMDGQVYNNIRTALLKAQTSLRTRQPTSIAAAQLKNNPNGIARQTTYFNLFTNSGGIPIVVDGQMIGAIGVGGGAGGGDENCAIEGLKATFGEHVTLPVYPAPAGSGRPS